MLTTIESTGSYKISLNNLSGDHCHNTGFIILKHLCIPGTTVHAKDLSIFGGDTIEIMKNIIYLKNKNISILIGDEHIDITNDIYSIIFDTFEKTLYETAELNNKSSQQKRTPGRPIAMNEEKSLIAKSMHNKKIKINDICKILNVSKSSLYRYL